MSWLPKLVLGSTWVKYLRFLADTKNPQRAQARVWNEIRSELLGGAFWKEQVGASARLEDFEITDYESYRRPLQETFESGVSAFSGQPVMFFAESSGTSGTKKRFPLTALQREQFQRTTPPFLHSMIRRHSGFLQKPLLYFAAVMPQETSPSGIDIGFISNFNYRHIPKFLQKFYAFPIEIFRDSDTFFKWSPVYAMATDLSAMIAVTPSQIELFINNIESRREEIALYLETGGPLDEGLPPFSITPERLSQVKAALRKTGPLKLRDLWPSLEVVCCWKSSTCGLQLVKIAKHLEGVSTVDATYSATEGWMNVVLDDGIGGVLHPGAHVFEFIELGKPIEKENLLPLWKLETGKSYEIFLTTAMGFIRYRLYDTVQCTDFLNQSPKIHFVQKSGNTISLGLVQVAETELLQALEAVGSAYSGRFVFSPNEGGDGLVFCFQDDPPSETLIRELHEELMKINPYYQAYFKKNLIQRLVSQRLGSEHQAWAPPKHAQSKPSILVGEPLHP